MIVFFVVCGVALVAALLYVLARSKRRSGSVGASRGIDGVMLLSGPGRANAVAAEQAEQPSRAMVDVTPRGTSIKV